MERRAEMTIPGIEKLITRAEKLTVVRSKIVDFSERIGSDQGPDRLNYRLLEGKDRTDLMIEVGSMRKKITTQVIPHVDKSLGSTVTLLQDSVDQGLAGLFGISEIRTLVSEGHLRDEDLKDAEDQMEAFKSKMERASVSYVEFVRSLFPSSQKIDQKETEIETKADADVESLGLQMAGITRLKERQIAEILYEAYVSNPDNLVSGEGFASIIWPDFDLKKAGNNLNITLFHLRETLSGFSEKWDLDNLADNRKHGLYRLVKILEQGQVDEPKIDVLDEVEEQVEAPIIDFEILARVSVQAFQIKEMVREGNLSSVLLAEVNEALIVLGGDIEIDPEVAPLLNKFDKNMEGVIFTDRELNIIRMIKRATTQAKGAKMEELMTIWTDDVDEIHKRDRATKMLIQLNNKIAKRHWEIINKNRVSGRGIKAEYVFRDNTPAKLEFSGDDSKILLDGREISLTVKQAELLKVLVNKAGQKVRSSEASSDAWQDSNTSKTGLRHVINVLKNKLNMLGKKELIVYSGRQSANSWVMLQGVEVTFPQ